MKRRYTLGRAHDVDFSVVDPANKVSRKHLEIVDCGSEFVHIKDLTSSNGTFLGDTRLIANKYYRVKKTTTIRLGPSFTIEFLKLLENGETKVIDQVDAEESTVQVYEPHEESPTYLVGRGNDADIVILDPKNRISRRHLKITELKDDLFLLKDLNSRNGTFVNGKPIPQQVEVYVSLEDKITLGEDYAFDLAQYFFKKSKVQKRPEHTTLIIAKDKQITFDINKVTLGEVTGLTEEGYKMVGRGQDSDIVIDHPGISRNHMKIRQLSPMIFEMVDLGSANKTFLDEKPIPANKSVKFRSDAAIRLGKQMNFQVKDHFDEVLFPSYDEISKQRVLNVKKYNQPTAADPYLRDAFFELKEVWLEYRQRQEQIAAIGENKIFAGSALGVIASIAAAWLLPGSEHAIMTGGNLIGKWLRARKKSQLSDSLNYETIFLETYCCPNCQYTFGFTAWHLIRHCQNCNVLYR